MEAKALLEVLAVVAPALAKDEAVPLMDHFCFSGNEVLATNDVISIRARLPEPVGDFTAQGAMLMKLLKTHPEGEVKFKTVDEGMLKFSVGRSSYELAASAAGNYPFVFPEVEDLEGHRCSINPKDTNLVEAFDFCSMAAPKERAVREEISGMYLKSDGAGCSLYATNVSTLAALMVNLPPVNESGALWVFPNEFCTLLPKMLRNESLEESEMVLGDEMTVIRLASGTSIYTKMIRLENPLDFEVMIENHVGDAAIVDRFDTPVNFDATVKRGSIISGGEPVTLARDGGELLIEATQRKWRMEEKLPVTGQDDKPQAWRSNYDPAALVRGAESLEITIGGRGAIGFWYPNGELYLVASRTE